MGGREGIPKGKEFLLIDGTDDLEEQWEQEITKTPFCTMGPFYMGNFHF